MNEHARSPRIAIIGAGAAGLMAACHAADAGAETLLLERTQDGGRKILISGGGRCNILPMEADPARFVTDSSPNTLRNIVRSWPLDEQRAWFERALRIPLADERASGKVFPASNRARDVRDALLARALRKGARFLPGVLVMDISPAGDGWSIALRDAPPLEADAVIVATGGLSVPDTGSDGAGLAMLKALGLRVHPTYAALAPITAGASPFSDLAGVSLRVRLTAESATRRAVADGGFLFTHRGYSGPAVLDVSHVAIRSLDEGGERAVLRAQWNGISEEEWKRVLLEGRGPVLGALRTALPERLALALLSSADLDPALPLAQLRKEDRGRVLDALVRCPLPWKGHEGYRVAEVTGGGVDLAELSPRTLESKRHPGLHVCGEALDAFGPIGGYNFLWAWATGRAAGLAAAKRVKNISS